MEGVKELVKLMKDKKELRGIDDRFVEKIMMRVLDEYTGIIDKYEESRDLKQFTRSMDYKILLKETRSMLREVYGVFIMNNYTKIEKAVKKLKEDMRIANHMKVLEMHKSSKERLPFYEKVYEKIFDITGEPKKILDLACGLNPFSYPFLGCEPEYYASDISPVLCRLINEYFDARKVKGEAFVFDMLNFKETKFSKYAESDVCFLFKALDSLETLEWDISGRIIKGIPATNIVVSFPRVSIGGGKKIGDERRAWFDELLEKQGLEHEFFKIPNESFYVVKK